MSTLFLLNPAAGPPRASRQLEAWIRAAYPPESGAEICQIHFPELGAQIGAALARGVESVYAVGGDGTAAAVGAHLMHRPQHFGIIPAGSGNGLARHAGIPPDTRKALAAAPQFRPRRIDAAQVNGRPFLNVLGTGVDAEVSRRYGQVRRRGFAAYLRTGAEGLLAFRSEPVRLRIDGEERHFPEVMGVLVANGGQWGYDARISAGAKLDDGLLDVLIVRRFPVVHGLVMAQRLFRGTFQDSPFVELHRAREVEIFREKPGYCQTDGEAFWGEAHLRVSLHPASLSLLAPASA
jgi:diacylglycerol kinase family enzyme